MKQKARELRKDLFIVDTGDTHDGNINNCCVNFSLNVLFFNNPNRKWLK